MTIDINKQYVTRDGRAVRILCTDAPGEFPVVALVPEEGVTTYTSDGHYWGGGATDSLDLVEKPTEVYRTVGPVSDRSPTGWGEMGVGAYVGNSMEDLARQFLGNKIPAAYKTVGVFGEDGNLLRVEANPNA